MGLVAAVRVGQVTAIRRRRQGIRIPCLWRARWGNDVTYGLTDFIGNIGVAMIVVAYFLLQTGTWGSQSRPYLALNIAGSLLILVSLWFDFNLSSVVIQVFWIAISLMGLVRSGGRGR